MAVFEDNGGDCHQRSVPSFANSIEWDFDEFLASQMSQY